MGNLGLVLLVCTLGIGKFTKHAAATLTTFLQNFSGWAASVVNFTIHSAGFNTWANSVCEIHKVICWVLFVWADCFVNFTTPLVWYF